MIYLDNGATSFPKPKTMIFAMEQCISNYCGNPGRSGHTMSMKTAEGIYNARKSAARFFKVKDPSRIIFTKNTTESLNIGIRGVLRPGDHVVTTAMEHNSVLRPLKELERFGVTCSIVTADEKGRISRQNIERSIKSNTKMIVMTAASNVTGTKMPIKEVGELARTRGLLFLLDGAQGAGNIDMDVEEMCIDMLAVPGHKGLLGPLGTGMLYVRPGVEIDPLIAGGTGTLSKNIAQPKGFPEGFEAGTVNAPAIIGLKESIDYVSKIGPSVIGGYEEELVEYLDENLLNMDFIELYGPKPEEKTGISLINMKGIDSQELTTILNNEYGIAVRGGFHCAGLAHKQIGTWQRGGVRISVGPFNTKKELQILTEALWKINKTYQ